ncbi:MAG: S41 family peptidase [Sphingobacteriales bacterium]|nr:MAG: S41 family peptidase [Sphingobacteriales bacterium]
MKFSIPKFSRTGRGFLAGLGCAALVGLFVQGKDADAMFEISKNLDVFTSLFKELNGYYVDPIEPGRLVKTGVDAMLNELDPYTNYITESDVEDYEFQTTGRYGGIGTSLQTKSDDIVIGEIYEGTPAMRAGLHPGDIVLAVDNQSIKGKSVDAISTLLKGSPGTPVAIKVKDAFTGAETVKMVTREQISLSSVPYAGLTGTGNNVAYVKLTQFTPDCTRQIRSALDSLKGTTALKGVILDLRNNPGGLLDEAVNLCNLFVDRGQLVVSTKGKMEEWDKEFRTTGAPWDTEIPLTVLINGSSASASEIVAGTMQDLDRGVVIGDKSYGKGLVQTTRRLGYNAQLKLTTARYYTPSGRCIQQLDYAHRSADGRVSNIPDSLKKTYKTTTGRLVKSGGGVEPDVQVKDSIPSRLVIALYTKGFIFDWATRYNKDHKTLPAPAQFALSDADFDNFATYLDSKDFRYRTNADELFDSLKAVATREGTYTAAKGEFAALSTKLAHDKRADLNRQKSAIKDLLENEIASRYYYQKGRIQQSFRNDAEYARATALLQQPTEYKKLLRR